MPTFIQGNCLVGESAILSWMLALPVAGAAAVWLLPASQVRRPWTGARAVALLFGVATLLVAGMVAGLVDYTTGTMQLVHRATRINALPLHYTVGVDGLSMPLVL